MVPDANPADLALETRAVKFVLDYDGAKEIEYERARGVESPRTGTIVQRSWLRRAAESLGFICGAGQFPRDVRVPCVFSVPRSFTPNLSTLPSASNVSQSGTLKLLQKARHTVRDGRESVLRFRRICAAHRGRRFKIIHRLVLHRASLSTFHLLLNKSVHITNGRNPTRVYGHHRRNRPHRPRLRLTFRIMQLAASAASRLKLNLAEEIVLPLLWSSVNESEQGISLIRMVSRAGTSVRVGRRPWSLLSCTKGTQSHGPRTRLRSCVSLRLYQNQRGKRKNHLPSSCPHGSLPPLNQTSLPSPTFPLALRNPSLEIKV